MHPFKKVVLQALLHLGGNSLLPLLRLRGNGLLVIVLTLLQIGETSTQELKTISADSNAGKPFITGYSCNVEVKGESGDKKVPQCTSG